MLPFLTSLECKAYTICVTGNLILDIHVTVKDRSIHCTVVMCFLKFSADQLLVFNN